jgi:alkylation response protein AidB-like acyl-CoA dehydrogenase
MPSILKIKGTEILQSLSELMLQAVGPYGLLFERDAVGPEHAAGLAPLYCNLRKLSIFGGSNEIQKNIVSQMVLGL